MAQRKDYQLAKTNTFALEKDTYELLLKYAGLASEPILAKEKLIAIDPATKAILIRLANRIAADAISVEDAGEYYNSKILEEVLQEIGTGIGTITNAIWDIDHDTGIQVEENPNDNTIRFDVEGIEVLNAAAALWVFNENGDDVDFRWEGDTEINLLYLDAGTDRVGIGTAVPTYELDVVGNIGLDEYLYHNDDPNTYLRFEADHLHIYVGGIDIFDAIGTAIVLNDGSANVDFRVEGNANANLLVLDAGNNNISINALPVSANYDLGLLGDGVLCLAETDTPAADANYGKVYCKNTDRLYFQDGAGVEKTIAALTAGEVTQLENINATTISIAQWGYLGAATQGIWTTTAKARAYLSAQQVNLTHVTWHMVDLDLENFDPGLNFDIGTRGSGTATGTVANHLIDAGYDFAGDGILVGMRIKNTTDTTYTYITAVAVGDLTLRDNIFVNTETWEVRAAEFTVPIDGTYLISVGVTFANCIADKRYTFSVRKNNVAVSDVSLQTSIADYLSVVGSDILDCTAGDYINLWARSKSGGNTVDISPGAQATFLGIHFLSN